MILDFELSSQMCNFCKFTIISKFSAESQRSVADDLLMIANKLHYSYICFSILIFGY